MNRDKLKQRLKWVESIVTYYSHELEILQKLVDLYDHIPYDLRELEKELNGRTPVLPDTKPAPTLEDGFQLVDFARYSTGSTARCRDGLTPKELLLLRIIDTHMSGTISPQMVYPVLGYSNPGSLYNFLRTFREKGIIREGEFRGEYILNQSEANKLLKKHM